MKSKLSLALLALALVALAVPALSVAGRNTTEVESKMKGKFVVDGGIKKGGATIQISLKPTQKKLCFDFDGEAARPAHRRRRSHKGARGRRRARRRCQLFPDDARASTATAATRAA